MFQFFKKRKYDLIDDLSPETDKFLSESILEHNKNIDELNNIWGFSNFKRWEFDQYSGIFRLYFDTNSLVEAKGQIFGSWHKRNKTWEWSWNNPNDEESMKIDSKKIKEYGEKNDLKYLISGFVPCLTELHATYLSAISEKVTNSQGVYPGDAGDLIVFIGLKELSRINS